MQAGRMIGAAALAVMLGLGSPALADVKAGVDAWQQGDYARAIAEWRPLAQAGDPDAQFNMGQAYKLGRGVQSDFPVALDWYRKAAAQGHLRAEDNLGLLMFQQGDRADAMPYLQRAALRGEPRAQYIVGTALFNGDLIGKDWVRAYALMSRASASGLTQATTSLAQMAKYIPDDQRRQGLAMAASLEKGNSETLASAPAAPTRPNPPPVRTAARPAPSPAGDDPAAARASIQARARRAGPRRFGRLARAAWRLQPGRRRAQLVEPADRQGRRPVRLSALFHPRRQRDAAAGRTNRQQRRRGTAMRPDQGRRGGLLRDAEVTARAPACSSIQSRNCATAGLASASGG